LFSIEKGVPVQLATKVSNIGQVPPTSLLSTEAAVKHFEQTGGKLKRLETYGIDPLEAYEDLKVSTKNTTAINTSLQLLWGNNRAFSKKLFVIFKTLLSN